jgi:hypothetical protein
MKSTNVIKFFTALMASLLLSSCTVIGDIFKTGMGVGIFIVIFIIALIGGIILAIGRKK